MISIKTTFVRATTSEPGFSTFWLLVFAIAILDDEQRQEDERRRKREAQPRTAKPPRGPQP